MRAKIYGYVRVSTKEQHIDRQLLAMRAQGVARENIFVDRQSGKDFARPAYQQMLKALTQGNILVINIKTRYLIQSHLWVQSSKSLATRGFGDFAFGERKASQYKMTRCRLI